MHLGLSFHLKSNYTTFFFNFMLYKICALKIRRHAHVLVWCLFILTDDDADPLYKVENDKEYYDNVGKKGYLLILNSKSNRTGTAAHYTVNLP